MARGKNVCWDCRIAFKGTYECPTCDKKLTPLGYGPRPPRHSNISAWVSLRKWWDTTAAGKKFAAEERAKKNRKQPMVNAPTCYRGCNIVPDTKCPKCHKWACCNHHKSKLCNKCTLAFFAFLKELFKDRQQKTLCCLINGTQECVYCKGKFCISCSNAHKTEVCPAYRKFLNYDRPIKTTFCCIISACKACPHCGAPVCGLHYFQLEKVNSKARWGQEAPCWQCKRRAREYKDWENS